MVTLVSRFFLLQGSLLFLCVLCIVYLVTFQTILKDILCYICSLKSLLLKLVSAHVWTKSYLNSQNKREWKTRKKTSPGLCRLARDGPSLKNLARPFTTSCLWHSLAADAEPKDCGEIKAQGPIVSFLRKHPALHVLDFLASSLFLSCSPLHFWWCCQRRSKPYFTSLLQKEAYHFFLHLQSKPERVLEYFLPWKILLILSITVVSANPITACNHEYDFRELEAGP